jgi:hypothetical protein
MNGRLEARGKNFGDELKDAILERDRTKIARCSRGLKFWEKHEEGTVDTG